MATNQDSLAPTGNAVAIALIVAGVISLLILGTAFALFALDIEYFWIVFPVGFGGVLPVALGLVALWTT
jgi:hypothetical protein